ncbi:LysR substrate-binding domain-containing protein [Halomonas alkalisoli]|uniref:LysR substrate-binding domain-containing protein n=1 Tax=Halomonas alkalisoli TaxID=2907158 RepID=UPI001F190212|nr:LysR substrate-binding domain-containing protein [Halomonas alkalisoli]
MIAALKRRRPRLSVSIDEQSSDRLLQALEYQQLDLVIGRLTAVSQRNLFDFEPLLEEPLRVVVGSDHPLADADIASPRRHHRNHLDPDDTATAAHVPDAGGAALVGTQAPTGELSVYGAAADQRQAAELLRHHHPQARSLVDRHRRAGRRTAPSGFLSTAPSIGVITRLSWRQWLDESRR